MTRLPKLCTSAMGGSAILRALNHGTGVMFGFTLACLAILVWILSSDRVVERFNTLLRGVPLPPRSPKTSGSAGAERAETSVAAEAPTGERAMPAEPVPDRATTEEQIEEYITLLRAVGSPQFAKIADLIERRLTEPEESVDELRRRYAGKSDRPA